MLGDFVLECNNEGKHGGSNGAVVNMHNDDYGGMTFVTTMMVEHSLAHVTLLKPQLLHQYLHELLVPTMTQLLQAVQHLQQVADLSGGIWCRIARGLLHEDPFILGEFSIEISAFDIDLMQLEIQFGGHHKDSPNQPQLCNWRKRVEIIDTQDL